MIHLKKFDDWNAFRDLYDDEFSISDYRHDNYIIFHISEKRLIFKWFKMRTFKNDNNWIVGHGEQNQLNNVPLTEVLEYFRKL